MQLFSRINRFRTVLALPVIFASPFASAAGTGGLLEQAGSLDVRAVPSAGEIQNFVPARGAFTFPAPYNTQAVRLTNESDCGGNDCVQPVGYSYWNNINNHAGFETMLILVGLDKNEGGSGPTLVQYNKVTEALTNLGPLFSDDNPLAWHSGEGWYFSATLPTKLYIPNGSQFLRHDVMTGESQVVFDSSAAASGTILWQMHSSADDRVHSATVRDANSYEMLGCMAYEEDSGKTHYFPKQGEFDECQIDKSGRWLVIKEDVDGADGEDNRIIDLTTGSERVLLDRDGAAGHSDLGYGYMIAADNFSDKPNVQKLWDFNSPELVGREVYFGSDWYVGAPAHVSHGNAKDASSAGQYACGSSVNRGNGNAANEVICFTLDGSGRTMAVAPVMTDLDASGGGSDDYVKYPKGNLDVTGEYFIWTSNLGGSRMDVFLVKVPGAGLAGAAQ